jgi:glucose/arabinose dehydrogenase
MKIAQSEKISGSPENGPKSAQSAMLRNQIMGQAGRVLVMPDGALLVSDDLAGVIYRISYRK